MVHLKTKNKRTKIKGFYPGATILFHPISYSGPGLSCRCGLPVEVRGGQPGQRGGGRGEHYRTEQYRNLLFCQGDKSAAHNSGDMQERRGQDQEKSRRRSL